jgi:NAD(P)-dependent dehydrogenase (short-subunit alcohol dehydrogenase family)
MTDHIALVTGADRGLGFALCQGLLARDWHVFAGQYMPDWPELATLAAQFPEKLHIIPLDVSSSESVQAAAQRVSASVTHVDLLINNAGIARGPSELRQDIDYVAAHRLYDVNTLGPVRIVDAFLPLTDQSALKRLCFVSSEAGSIARSRRTSGFTYCMSKAALNMGVKIMFNHLRPEGYTFRLYHPGWMRSYMSGVKNTKGDMEPEESAKAAIPFFIEDQADENRLVMIDYTGQEWPW